MWKFLILGACAFYNNINLVKGQATPVIIGGHEVTDNTYKFMVYISYEKGEGVTTCSASLIHVKWVLTSAHCFEDSPQPEKVLLLAGQPKMPPYFEKSATNLQKRKALQVYINENYDFDNRTTNDNDIALIEVDTPFELNENVSCVEYFKEKPGWADEEYKDCTIVGFGRTEQGTDGTLFHALHNHVLPAKKCQEAHPQYILNDHFVCIFNNVSGICSGDSGGPLLCDDKVYGLSAMSWTLWENCTHTEDSHFLLVEPYAEWITQKMEGETRHAHGLIIGLLIVILMLIILVVLLFIYIRKKHLIYSHPGYALMCKK